MIILAGLSMVLTPLLVYLAEVISSRFSPEDQELVISEKTSKGLNNHVIIAGYGRVGQSVANILNDHSVSYVALDLNAESVRQYRQGDEPVFYGDAARSDILAQIGAEKAKLILITLDEPIAAIRIVQAVKKLWPDLTIIVRSRDAQHSDELYRYGADEVMPETVEASLQLAAMTLEHAEVDTNTISGYLEDIRAHGYRKNEQLPD